MTEQEELDDKIEQQNQVIEEYFQLLEDVQEGEKITIKALGVYQLQGSGFIQANNGFVKGVMQSDDKMLVDKYSPVNEDLSNLDEETVIQLEERTVIGIDQKAANNMSMIIGQAIQENAENQAKEFEKQKAQQTGFNREKDLNYIG